MIGLTGLWAISLALSAAALTIMAGLIIARLLASRRRRRTEKERSRLLPLLLGGDTGTLNLPQGDMASELLTDLSVELIHLVRGEDRERFVAAATQSGVAATLRKRANKGSHRARLTAIEALAAFPDALSTDTLEAALDDRHADVRLCAAMALAGSGRAPPPKLLVNKLGLGTREQSMMMTGLFERIAQADADAIKQLIVDPDVPAPVKAAAIDALSGSGDYSLVPIVNDLALRTPSESDSLPRFLRALGAFHHPAGSPAVLHCLSSPVWFVRAAAAEAAGKIGMAEAAADLNQLLNDPDWWVRFRAGEALVKLGQEGRALLVEASRTAGEPARSAAAMTLAEQGIRA